MKKLVLFYVMELLCSCTAETNKAWWIVGIFLVVPLMCWLIILLDKKGKSKDEDKDEEKVLTHSHHVEDVMKKIPYIHNQ